MESKGREQGWDSIAREQLKETNNLQKKAEVVAVVMQEGFANICFVTQYHTILRQKVELAVPKKLVSQRATERTPFPISHTTSVLPGITLALL
jgi:stalled ribosome rescue protein Dom34